MDLGGFCWERVDWGFWNWDFGVLGDGAIKCLGKGYLVFKTRCGGVGNGGVSCGNDNSVGFALGLVDLWKTMWKTF